MLQRNLENETRIFFPVLEKSWNFVIGNAQMLILSCLARCGARDITHLYTESWQNDNIPRHLLTRLIVNSYEDAPVNQTLPWTRPPPPPERTWDQIGCDIITPPPERTWDQTGSVIIAPPPRTTKVGGTHPTGMLSCLEIDWCLLTPHSSPPSHPHPRPTRVGRHHLRNPGSASAKGVQRRVVIRLHNRTGVQSGDNSSTSIPLKREDNKTINSSHFGTIPPP